MAGHFGLTPIPPLGSDQPPNSQYNRNALMELHIQQVKQAPKQHQLATAGLLGQPATDSGCAAAPSLQRFKVSSLGLGINPV